MTDDDRREVHRGVEEDIRSAQTGATLGSTSDSRYESVLKHLKAAMAELYRIPLPEDPESRALNHGDHLRDIEDGR